MRLTNLVLNNIGLKVLSLFLAFITLIYVGETTREDPDDRTVLQKFFTQSDFMCKKLAIKPIFVGNPPPGHVFLRNEVKVFPDSVLVLGPARYIADKEFIFTKPIDLSEHSKTKTLGVDLESISRSIRSEEVKSQIYIPIVKSSGSENGAR